MNASLGQIPVQFKRSGTRKNTELSLIASRMLANNYKTQNAEHSISILMLESYLSDICRIISEGGCITETLYSQISAMKNILNDCMILSNISLEFYRQVETALSFIAKIYEYSCTDLIKDLAHLLMKIVSMIKNYGYLSSTLTVPIRGNKNISINEILAELKIRISRVTPRIINVNFKQIWRKILSPIREFEKVSLGFLKFYCEVDPVIHNVTFEDPVAAMYRYTRNPGHIVQTVRKTVAFLESELISIRNAREIHEIMQDYPPEVIGCVDKTMSGYVIWDLIRYSLDYYRIYGLFHYNIDIFQKDLILDTHDMISQSIFNSSTSLMSVDSNHKCHSPTKKKSFNRISTAANFKSKKVPELKLNGLLNTCKAPENKKKSLEKKTKDLSFDDHSNDYDNYISEKFQEFLMEKIKKSSEKNQISLRENRNDLIIEFEEYMENLDHKSITKLWDEANFNQETSKLSSRTSI